MNFNYDADVLSMNMIERIREACRQTRQREEEISALTEQNRNETRLVRIEENRARIDRLNNEIEEFNQMTIASTREYAEFLDNVIQKNIVPSIGRENVRDRAIEIRLQLNDVLKEYSDIFHGEVRTVEYGGAHTSNNSVSENPIDDIENHIEKFKNDCDTLTEHLNSVQASLILDNEIDLINEVIGLDNELSELANEAEQLKNEIDAFRESFGNADFSMTVPEMQKQIKDFRSRVKTIKRLQIDRYNARVETINNRIVNLKSMTDVSPEIASMISELNKLETMKNNVSWNSRTYKNIDYNKLVEVNNKINEINEKFNITDKDTHEGTYEDDFRHIENEINRIAYELPFGNVDMLKDDINQAAINVNSLMVKLTNDKDKLSDEVYNQYLARLNDCQSNLAELNERLKGLKNNTTKSNDYKELFNNLNDVSDQVTNLSDMIDALYGKVTEDALIVFESRLDGFDEQLAFIESEIEKRYNENKLDEGQYQNLIDKVAAIRNKIIDTRNKLKNPEMIKGVDVFAFLNGQIDGIEKAINLLEEQIDKLEKPIKDKETRKKIDLIIDRIEKEINAIQANLELHKDDDPEKYNEVKERLEKQKARLEELNKKYRKKSPFLVKTVKSAKDFYKKHKKVVLIALGLAAIALIHATIGPVIIPAIMHGNLMMMHSVPAIRGTFMGINNVLGNAIRAKVINHIWTLANGVTIAPYCASASLLKGIAISGMGTAAIVTPLVIAVKDLINKMNLQQLKDDISKNIAEGKVKVENVRKQIKEKTNSVVDNAKGKITKLKNKKKTLKELKELLKKYQESKLSFEEFCEDNGLSEKEIDTLKSLDKKAGGR